MRVDWSQNLADPPADRRSDPSSCIGVAASSAPAFVGQRGGRSADQSGPADHHARLHRLHAQAEPHARLLRLLQAVRRRRRGRARGAAATPRSPSATRCCRFPTSEYEPLSYPDRQVLTRHRRQADAHGVRLATASSPARRPSLKAERADAATTAPRRRSISSPSSASSARRRQPTTGRSARPRRGASTSRTAGTSGRRRSRRTPTASRARRGRATRCASPIAERKTRTITYYMNPEFPDDQTLRDMAAPDRRRLEPGDEGDGRRLLLTGAGRVGRRSMPRPEDAAPRRCPTSSCSRRTTATSRTSRRS